MTTTARQIRAWTGPAILGYGFRPLFLLAALWAVLAMALWVPMLAGRDLLPIAFDPIAWHAHEVLLGYLTAVIGGFLLTAVPNWTGRLPVVGWPLAGLVALWLLGRIAVGIGALLPWGVVLVADLAFGLVLLGFLLREIAAGGNWRNLPVAGLLAVIVAANALFHIEASAEGYGMRLALAAVMMLIALIGGRIIPSFTRNWLAARRMEPLPQPFGKGDKLCLGLTGVTLMAFVALPEAGPTALLCLLAGLANLWRQGRWRPFATGAEPLLWVLHVGYGFVGLGFLARAAVAPGWLEEPAALHVWLAGAIGVMTLAVMSRASLGHSGRALTAGPGLVLCYGALIASVPLRLAVGWWPGATGLLHGAATLWILGFGGFALLFWPVLTRPALARKAASRA